MNRIPEELRYNSTHEWVRLEDKDIAVIGLTEYAAEYLGEVSFVQIPDADIHIHANDEVCSLEAAKANLEVASPLSGQIIAVNEELWESPSLINTDPYGDGWLFKIKIQDLQEYKELLDADGYKEQLAELMDH